MVSPAYRRPARRGLSLTAGVIIALLSLGTTGGGTFVASHTFLKKEKWEPPPKEEAEKLMPIAFLPETELPEPEAPKPKLERKKKEKLPEPEPEPEPEEEPEPEPEPEKEPEPEPEPEPPQPKPKPPELLPDHMKMVEQMEEFDEEEVPENYEFLSNINRRVLEQTRAAISNLIEDAKVAQASQMEPSTSPDKGMAAEDEIAEQREQKSRIAREAPKARPEKENLRPEQQDPNPSKRLAMRDLAPQAHEEAMVEREELAREATDGTISAASEKTSSIAPVQQEANTPTHDQRYAFSLSSSEMDAAFGKDLDGPRRDASEQKSKKKGVWDDARARYQSPLENMVPEIQPGNQTALGSRKHPFAAYIAQMHRPIHKGWAWGFLEGLDARGANHPLNDQSLRTVVEIVLNRDGTIDKLTTVKYSGNSVFDAAARENVFASGPFPNPPDSIVSPDGKIYVHWAFNRNNRACGTFQATPFIRDGSSAPNNDVYAGEGGGQVESPEQLRRLARGAGGRGETTVPAGPSMPPGQGGTQGGAQGGFPEHGAHDGHGHAQPAGPGPSPGVAPRQGAGSAGAGPGGPGGGEGRGGLLAGPRTAAGPSFPAGPSPSRDDAQAVDPNARAAADAWVLGLTRKQVNRMLSRSSYPFSHGGQVIARSKEELEPMFEAMVEEVSGSRQGPVSVYSAAGMRKAFGSLPAGVSEGEGRAYAVANIGGDRLVLILQKKFGAWRVVGTTR